MIDDQPSFDDGRGRFPDRIAAAAPRGFRAEVKRAAQAERITMGEFVRRAICARLTTIAVPDDDGPSNFPSAAASG